MELMLSSKSRELLKTKVAEGAYASESDVVEDSLALLERRDHARAFEQSLIDADASIDRGEGLEWTPELMEQIWREGDEMYRRGEKPDPYFLP